MSTITVYQTPGGADPNDVAFASVEEVASRTGRTFTTGETERVQWLLTTASSNLAEACGKDDEWAADLTDVPTALRTTVIEMVTRVLQNPGGVRSQSRTLGKHASSQSFADASATLDPTEAEIRRCNAAVWKDADHSARIPSIVDTVGPWLGETGSKYKAEDVAT